jgi:hypothetical protein
LPFAVTLVYSSRMPKPDDDKAPATKADIQLLMAEIGKLYDANERWKDELKGHFDLTVENIRTDLTGANKDRLEGHENRIARLEKHVGFVA